MRVQNVPLAPPGRYGDQLAQIDVLGCKSCRKGYFCFGNASIFVCPAGHYQDQAEQTRCKACESGYNCQKDAQQVCIAGRYGSEVHQKRNSSCAACPVGKYGTRPGQTSESMACTYPVWSSNFEPLDSEQSFDKLNTEEGEFVSARIQHDNAWLQADLLGACALDTLWVKWGTNNDMAKNYDVYAIDEFGQEHLLRQFSSMSQTNNRIDHVPGAFGIQCSKLKFYLKGTFDSQSGVGYQYAISRVFVGIRSCSNASWVKVAVTDGYGGGSGDSAAFGTAVVWGDKQHGSVYSANSASMTTFRDNGVPSQVRICLENEGSYNIYDRCTDGYDVYPGAQWEAPAANTYNSLSLKLVGRQHGVPQSWFLVMARGGLGLCMNQRTDRTGNQYTCDGDGDQANNQVGLMDNWNTEGGSVGGGGRWKAAFEQVGWPAARNTFAALYFYYHCPAGQYLVSEGGCRSCPLGRYNDHGGQTLCRACSAGQYNDRIGQTFCKLCTAAPNHWCPESGTSGSGYPCEAGKYRPGRGSVGNESVCSECPRGFYCGVGEFKADVVHTFTTQGATALSTFTRAGELWLSVANHRKGTISAVNYDASSFVYEWTGTELEQAQTIDYKGTTDMKAFHMSGSDYLVVTNYHVDSMVLKWNGFKYADHQVLDTTGASDCEYFEINGESFLAVANYASLASSASNNIDSLIYKWDVHQEKFLEHQQIATKAAHDWEVLHMANSTFIMVANQRSGSWSTSNVRVNSILYWWTGSKFARVQAIPTIGAAKWTQFSIQGNHYAAVSNRYSGDEVSYPRSAIYQWAGRDHTNSTRISIFSDEFSGHIGGSCPGCYFVFDGRQLSQLEMDDSSDENNLLATNTRTKERGQIFIWSKCPYSPAGCGSTGCTCWHGRWNSAPIQTRKQSENAGVKQFQAGDTLLIESLTLFQELITMAAEDIKVFVLNRHVYLIVANSGEWQQPALSSFMYSWNGQNFVKNLEIDTIGATSWTHFQADGLDYLAVANGQCTSDASACLVADVGCGWDLVRRTATNTFPYKDQLRGTVVSGQAHDNPTSPISFTKRFDVGIHQFLFATGDCSRWMIMDNSAVRGNYYTNAPRNIIASHKSATPYKANMHRRSGNLEDPWITFTDHDEQHYTHCNSLYQENNYDPNCAAGDLGTRFQGLNVFVRTAHNSYEGFDQSKIYRVSSTTTKVACPAGRYGNAPGNVFESDCLPCPQGKFGVLMAQDLESGACSMCPPGRFGKEPGTPIRGVVISGRLGFNTEINGIYRRTNMTFSTSPVFDSSTNYLQHVKGYWQVTARFLGAETALLKAAKTSSSPLESTWVVWDGYAFVSDASILVKPNACSECPAGRSTNGSHSVTSSLGCRICAQGYYCGKGSASVPCPPGKYGNMKGRPNEETGCLACPAGKYADQPSQTLCKSCPTGASSSSGSSGCTSCEVGFYCQVECTCPGKAYAYACPPGKYGIIAGQSRETDACAVCEPGYYCAGGTSRIPCPIGKYGTLPSQTNESFACPGSCPDGAFPTSAGQTTEKDACISCPQGKYENAGLCFVCANCELGFAMMGCRGKAAGSCEPCSRGAYCVGGNSSFISCPAGRYGNVTNADTIDIGCPGYCPSGRFGEKTGQRAAASACPHACPAGKYGHELGQVSEGAACPNRCESGRFGRVVGQNNNQNACNNSCPLGRYGTPAPGQTALDAACPNFCPPGKYGTAVAAKTISGCASCESGYYCAGVISRAKCPPGKYANIVEQETINDCNGCEAGFFCVGGSNRSSCVPGKYGTQGLQSSVLACKVCGVGYWCEGSSHHLQCPPGRYGIQSAQSDGIRGCMSCPMGFYCSGGSNRTACLAGTYGIQTGQRTESDCTTCEAGHWCNGTARHYACQRGRYSDKLGQKSSSGCLPCHAGTYSDRKGQATCSPCPAGRYVLTNANRRCKPCEVGSYCPGPGSHQQMVACHAGSYGNLTSQTSSASCHTCEYGYVCPGGVVKSACNRGKYGDQLMQSESVSCKLCDRGYFCGGGSQREMCLPGKFGDTFGADTAASCIPCTPGFYCTGGTKRDCPVGTYGNVTAAVSEANGCPGRCDNGLVGFTSGQTSREDACSICTSGQYYDGSHCRSCTACASGTYIKDCGGNKQGTCETCEEGKYCRGGPSKPADCPSGRFGNISGQATEAAGCSRLCPRGKFGNVTGQTTEELACRGLCSSGKFGGVEGATTETATCTVCTAGRYGQQLGQASEKSGCDQMCPSGRYGSVVGQQSLSLACPGVCDNGKYNLLSGQTQEHVSNGHCAIGSTNITRHQQVPCGIKLEQSLENIKVIFPQPRVFTTSLSSVDNAAETTWETISAPGWLLVTPLEGVLSGTMKSGIQMTLQSSAAEDAEMLRGNWTISWTRRVDSMHKAMGTYTTTFPVSMAVFHPSTAIVFPTILTHALDAGTQSTVEIFIYNICNFAFSWELSINVPELVMKESDATMCDQRDEKCESFNGNASNSMLISTSWVDIEERSGTLDFGTGIPASVPIQVDARQMSVGEYKSTISFKNSLDERITVPVRIYVQRAQCPPGTYKAKISGQEHFECLKCPVNTYNTLSSRTSKNDCHKCVAHASTNGTTGATSAEQCICDDAFFMVNGTCSQCDVETYLPDGELVCQHCPAGTNKEMVGQMPCQPCPAGFECLGSGNKKRACLKGKLCKTGTAQMEDCPAGYFCATPVHMEPCSEEEKQYCTSGSVEPQPCPSNHFCPEAKYQLKVNHAPIDISVFAVSEYEVTLRWTVHPDTSADVRWHVIEWTHSTGKQHTPDFERGVVSAPLRVPENQTFVSISVNHSLEHSTAYFRVKTTRFERLTSDGHWGYHKPAGVPPWATSGDCKDDEYLENSREQRGVSMARFVDAGNWSCRDCPQGMSCEGAITRRTLLVKRGWWRYDKHVTLMYPCSPLNGSIRKACLGWTENNLTRQNESCHPGHAPFATKQVPLCAVCLDDFAKNSIGVCERCPSKRNKGLGKFMIGVFIFLFLIGMGILLRSKLQMIHDRFEIQKKIDIFHNRFKEQRKLFQKRDTTVEENHHSGRYRLMKSAVHFAMAHVTGDAHEDEHNRTHIHETRKAMREAKQKIQKKLDEKSLRHHVKIGKDVERAIQTSFRTACSSLKLQHDRIFESSLKIVSGFYQVFLTLHVTFLFEFPEVFLQFQEKFAFLQLQFYRLLGLRCLFKSDYIFELYVMTLGPIVLSLLLLVYYVCATLSINSCPRCHNCCFRKKSKHKKHKGFCQWFALRCCGSNRREAKFNFWAAFIDDSSTASDADEDDASISESAAKPLKKSIKDTCWFAFLLLTFLIYTSCSSKVIAYFKCIEIAGSSYLQKDLTINCNSDYYRGSNYAFAALMVVVYPIGIFLLYAYLIYKYRHTLRPEEFRDKNENVLKCIDSIRTKLARSEYAKYANRQFTKPDELIELEDRLETLRNHYLGMQSDKPENEDSDATILDFLCAQYTPEYYYFELFEQIRKLFLTSLVLYVDLGSPIQTAVGILVCVFTLCIYAFHQPFNRRQDNIIAILAQLSLLFTMILGLFARLETVDSAFASGKEAGIILILFMMVPFIALIAQFVYLFEILENRYQKIFECCCSSRRRKRTSSVGFFSATVQNAAIKNSKAHQSASAIAIAIENGRQKQSQNQVQPIESQDGASLQVANSTSMGGRKLPEEVESQEWEENPWDRRMRLFNKYCCFWYHCCGTSTRKEQTKMPYFVVPLLKDLSEIIDENKSKNWFEKLYKHEMHELHHYERFCQRFCCYLSRKKRRKNVMKQATMILDNIWIQSAISEVEQKRENSKNRKRNKILRMVKQLKGTIEDAHLNNAVLMLAVQNVEKEVIRAEGWKQKDKKKTPSFVTPLKAHPLRRELSASESRIQGFHDKFEEEKKQREEMHEKIRQEQRKRRISRLKKRKTLRDAAKLAANVNLASQTFGENNQANRQKNHQVLPVAIPIESRHLEDFLDGRTKQREEGERIRSHAQPSPNAALGGEKEKKKEKEKERQARPPRPPSSNPFHFAKDGEKEAVSYAYPRDEELADSSSDSDSDSSTDSHRSTAMI